MRIIKKTKGITLVALVVTVIVLLLLAGITIVALGGENGLIARVKQSKESYSIAETKEKLELEITNLRIEQEGKGEELKKEDLSKIKSDEIEVKDTTDFPVKVFCGGYEFEINENFKVRYIGIVKFELADNEGLIGKVKNINNSGFTSVEVSGKNSEGEETKEYQLDVIYYDGDLVLDGKTEVEGATLNDDIYEFGNDSDVATANTEASRMVVLKVNGNLTIKEGVTVTAVKSEENYGGPKGLFIFCGEELNNKGTISMSKRGARATGENVYLWKNSDESFEYVPAVGATGGKAVTANSTGDYWVYSSGNKGNDSIGRQTGGGGSRIIIKLWGERN